jgi:hypothetical protein
LEVPIMISPLSFLSTYLHIYMYIHIWICTCMNMCVHINMIIISYRFVYTWSYPSAHWFISSFLSFPSFFLSWCWVLNLGPDVFFCYFFFPTLFFCIFFWIISITISLSSLIFLIWVLLLKSKFCIFHVTI